MSRRKRNRETASPQRAGTERSSRESGDGRSPNRSRSGRRIVFFIAVFFLLSGALCWLARLPLAWWARSMAQARLSDGAISTAQAWLDWSAWLDSRNGEVDLLRAACFRGLQQQDRWKAAVALAEQKGAPASLVRQETRLAQIAGGHFEGGVEGELAAMSTSDVPPNDLCAALVTGCLARKDPTWARVVLEAWGANHPKEASFAYMSGVYWLWMSESEENIERRRELTERAQQAYEKALAKQPRHELARVALAGLFEDQSRLEEAAASEAAAPASEAAALDHARLLRELGRLDEARRVLESLPRRSRASVKLAAQMAEIELESGRYREADRWFALAAVDSPEGAESAAAAACSSAIQEDPSRARQLFARIDGTQNRNVRVQDLAARLGIGKDDRQTEDELRRVTASPVAERAPGAGAAAQDRRDDAEATASGLYAKHCAGCHGDNGDGYGRATRHLFPKPRDLRTGRSRLVSTVNGIPSLADLEAVIRRGMPGTAMRAFDKLSDRERKLLAEEVRRLNRLGVREQFLATLAKEGETIDEREVREVVERGTTAADAVRVPSIGPADPQAAARGKEAYSKLGCHNCHGADGRGVADLPLFDEKGQPAPPRDLVHEPFKGGSEAESLYLRLLLGMPGTPHPACPGVAADQLIDLVHYCRSLAREPKRESSNRQRALQAWTPARRAGG